MKNKILIIIIILFQILLINKLFSKEIDFQATDIEFSNDQNLTIANNATAIFKDDGIIIEGKKIQYFKDKSFLIIDRGKISSIDKNFEINSEIIEYKIDESSLNFENNIVINDGINNLMINSNKINYDLNEQKITSQNYSEIFDNLNNTYKVDGFEYSIKDKIIKLNNLVVQDKDKNSFKVDMSYLDLNKKELIAKDISMNFKLEENSENEPRLKGRSLVSDNRNTIVKKGTFTFCKKRDNKCPPWEMSAEEIRHDKQKKIIYYKNASLKIYDKKVFYFPKFFHPDPTVKRQSGFLIPKFQDNSSAGLSFNLPYFLAIAENKDLTLTPRFFADDKILIQSEFRQKNKYSNHIADVSQFVSSGKNSNSHLFYNYGKNYETNNFDNVQLNVKLEQVSDETYLKTNKIESPIINNFSNLTNSLNFKMYNENLTFNSNLDVYEDLTKNDSDKFEYIPNFSFSKIIKDNYTFRSQGYYKNYNTNITEKVLINNFEFQSDLKYFDNGFLNEKKLILKNINTDATNSNNFKNRNTNSLIPSFKSDFTLPMSKETGRFNNILTPKLSLRLSIPYTKDIRSTDRTISYKNIYEFNRLGINESTEGGISATYGYEYVKINKSNFDEIMKFGFANNLRIEENKDLPANSSLGDKMSDFVGLFEYKFDDNFKFNYDFSIKNNLEDKNYELFGFEYYLKNLTTRFEFLNENNTNLKSSYLKNETKYKFNNRNSLIFETSENKEKSFTEYYNLIYQYENDCLRAGIEYNKEYYSDQELKPSENLIFKVTILPFGGFNTPNLK